MEILNIINGLGTGGVERVLIDTIDGTKDTVNHTILTKSNENIYLDYLTENNINVIQAPKFSKKNYVKHISFLRKYFKENIDNIDLIHFYGGSLNYYIPILLANYYKIPIIIHSHSSMSRNYLYNLIHKFFRFYHNLFGHSINIACSKNAGEWMFGTKEYQIIYNGIDLKKFSKFNHMKTNNKLIIGHVGAFLKVKNHKFLIDFLSFLKNKNIDVELKMVGNGPLLNEVKDYAKELNVISNVEFLGYQEDILSIFEKFDIMIFPSFFEGLPLTLIEAQAVGMPVLASNRIDPVIKINDNFLFFDIEENFETILNSFDLLIKTGYLPSKIKNSQFINQVMHKKILEVYNKIIESNR